MKFAFLLLCVLSLGVFADCDPTVTPASGGYDIVIDDYSVYGSGDSGCIVDFELSVPAGFQAEISNVAVSGLAIPYTGNASVSIDVGGVVEVGEYAAEQAFSVENAAGTLKTTCGAGDVTLSAYISIEVDEGYIGASSGAAQVAFYEC